MSDEQVCSMSVWKPFLGMQPEHYLEIARAIIAARDAMWSEMLGERKVRMERVRGEGNTIETYRAHISKELFNAGDVILCWVNEGDFWVNTVMHKNVSEIDTSEKRVQKSAEIKQVVGFGKVLGTYGVVESWPDTRKEMK
jgi:hypothetical protein